MPIVRLRQIKKEIRILGLTLATRSRGFRIIGVVFKGNMFLDGVLSSYAGMNQDLNVIVSRMIKASKHFNQIRVIIYDEDSSLSLNLDPWILFENTGKPVLSLIKDEEIDERFMFNWKSWTVFSAGLGKNDASKVLDVSTRDGEYPEVLRIAELISKGLHNL